MAMFARLVLDLTALFLRDAADFDAARFAPAFDDEIYFICERFHLDGKTGSSSRYTSRSISPSQKA